MGYCHLYIVWFEPLVFLALPLARHQETALDGEKSDRQAAVGYPQEGQREYPTNRK